MSTFDTELDSINNVCSLVKEIIDLSVDIESRTTSLQVAKDCGLIADKALTIKTKLNVWKID